MLIGVADTQEQGAAAAKQLKAGQAIVSMDGAYWRWDGLHIKAGSADRHALQLQQKNRLAELEKDYPHLESAAVQAMQTYEAAQRTYTADKITWEQAQRDLRADEQTLAARQAEI